MRTPQLDPRQEGEEEERERKREGGKEGSVATSEEKTTKKGKENASVLDGDLTASEHKNESLSICWETMWCLDKGLPQEERCLSQIDRLFCS